YLVATRQLLGHTKSLSLNFETEHFEFPLELLIAILKLLEHHTVPDLLLLSVIFLILVCLLDVMILVPQRHFILV
ncbi:hypothetical protein PENTCL1PPCAC_24726, partial [Pristionchus entomophagus]